MKGQYSVMLFIKGFCFFVVGIAANIPWLALAWWISDQVTNHPRVYTEPMWGIGLIVMGLGAVGGAIADAGASQMLQGIRNISFLLRRQQMAS